MSQRTTRAAGRPPKPPAERLRPAAFVRLAQAECEALERAARASGVTPGVYARKVLVAHLRRHRARTRKRA